MKQFGVSNYKTNAIFFSSAMSATSFTGLLIMPLAFFMCALLILLYVWLQARREQLAIQQRYQSLPSKRDLFAPTVSNKIQHGSQAYTAFPATTSRFSWESTYPIVAANCGIKVPAATIKQESDIHSPIRSTPPKSFIDTNSTTELLGNCRNLFQLKEGSIKRSSLESESAGLQPLPLVWTKQKTFQEQRIWRNSSSGSSCYSRPASWYSVLDLERGEDTTSLIRIGLTTQQEQELAWKYKPLPALPIE